MAQQVRIWQHPCCSLGHCCDMGSIPGPGISACHRSSQKGGGGKAKQIGGFILAVFNHLFNPTCPNFYDVKIFYVTVIF